MIRQVRGAPRSCGSSEHVHTGNVSTLTLISISAELDPRAAVRRRQTLRRAPDVRTLPRRAAATRCPVFRVSSFVFRRDFGSSRKLRQGWCEWLRGFSRGRTDRRVAPVQCECAFLRATVRNDDDAAAPPFRGKARPDDDDVVCARVVHVSAASTARMASAVCVSVCVCVQRIGSSDHDRPLLSRDGLAPFAQQFHEDVFWSRWCAERCCELRGRPPRARARRAQALRGV